jgi:chromosome segregation ATPase
MKQFWQRANNPTRTIKEEIAAATHSIDELAAQLADVEQKLSEAVLSVKALEQQRQGLQNELAETQRGRSDVEKRRGAMEAAIEEKLSEAMLSVKPLEEQLQSLQTELGKSQRHRGDVEISLALIEQQLSEVVTSVKMLEDQRKGLQNDLAEVQRRRADAELRSTGLLEAAEPTKESDRLENVAGVPLQIVTDYRTRLSTYAAGWTILIFAFIASFLLFAAVFGVIPW